MSKSQQEYVAKHLKKKGYLQQIQTLVDRINLLHTENKKKYPLKLELTHGFCYEGEEDPEYFFTLREKKNWLVSLNWPKRKITIFFHYRADGDWKKMPSGDRDFQGDDEMFEEAADDGWYWYKGPPCWVESHEFSTLEGLEGKYHLEYPCLVAQIADDFTKLEGLESKYADRVMDINNKALLNGKSIYDWPDDAIHYSWHMHADIDEEKVMDTLKKILMNVTKVDFN